MLLIKSDLISFFLKALIILLSIVETGVEKKSLMNLIELYPIRLTILYIFTKDENILLIATNTFVKRILSGNTIVFVRICKNDRIWETIKRL